MLPPLVTGRHRRTSAALVAVAALTTPALVGCGGGSDNPTVAAPSASGCPSSALAADSWPSAVPSDLPTLPGLHVTSTQSTSSGAHMVSAESPVALREAVRTLVTELPKAGYSLGKGDAEADEADAPFSKGDLHGSFRLSAQSSCGVTVTLTVGG